MRREEVDVLIVGCGPAGLTLAAQLVSVSGYYNPHRRTEVGTASTGPGRRHRLSDDGNVSGFRFSERVIKEGCWINETTFWRPDERDTARDRAHGRVQDIEDGLSEFPHVILNQARVHDFYLDVMRSSPNRLEPDYSRRLVGLEIDTKASSESSLPYPVTVWLDRVDAEHDGEVETIKARYVVGCDGARSSVRQSLGRTLGGDSANQAWGVMDVLTVTDFPDIRIKSLIQSADEG